MFMQIVLELLELLIGDHERIADPLRNCIIIGKVTDSMDCVADRFVFEVKFFQGTMDGLAVFSRRLISRFFLQNRSV